jgi:hypothetical protein
VWQVPPKPDWSFKIYAFMPRSDLQSLHSDAATASLTQVLLYLDGDAYWLGNLKPVANNLQMPGRSEQLTSANSTSTTGPITANLSFFRHSSIPLFEFKPGRSESPTEASNNAQPKAKQNSIAANYLPAIFDFPILISV